MFRVVVIALVIHGLNPSAAELVEALVHLAATGQVAHDAAHHESTSEDEHGCGPIAHHCVCCPNQPVVVRAQATPGPTRGLVSPVGWPQDRLVSDSPRKRPFRPPIEA